VTGVHNPNRPPDRCFRALLPRRKCVREFVGTVQTMFHSSRMFFARQVGLGRCGDLPYRRRGLALIFPCFLMF
jgi:hypothetical protein